MKRLLCGAAVAAALLISATPSSAQVVNMTATLTGAEETTATPGVLGILTGAVGTATRLHAPPRNHLAAPRGSGSAGTRTFWVGPLRTRRANPPYRGLGW